MKSAQTYGETVGAEAYASELQFHQYIPQADAVIADEIQKHQTRCGRHIRVLDLGMGPGRLTGKIAELPGVRVVGLDNSPEFVSAAKARGYSDSCAYVCADFLTYTTEEPFDVIFMEGVWHHVAPELRSRWLSHISKLLTQDGVLIIGDEYIPLYLSETERAERVGLFYLHIIGEALKIQNYGLARNECLNFLADTLHESEHRGYFDEYLLSFISAEAVRLNELQVSRDPILYTSEAGLLLEIKRLLKLVRTWSDELSKRQGAEWIDRGDYKVSVQKQINELEPDFKLVNRRDSGPVEHVGGMSVLTFTKSPQ